MLDLMVCGQALRRHLGTDAAHCYGGFLAVLSSWCEENNIPYQPQLWIRKQIKVELKRGK